MYLLGALSFHTCTFLPSGTSAVSPEMSRTSLGSSADTRTYLPSATVLAGSYGINSHLCASLSFPTHCWTFVPFVTLPPLMSRL